MDTRDGGTSSTGTGPLSVATVNNGPCTLSTIPRTWIARRGRGSDDADMHPDTSAPAPAHMTIRAKVLLTVGLTYSLSIKEYIKEKPVRE
jgi:hypothetical protein